MLISSYPSNILSHDEWVLFNREFVVKAHALNVHFDYLLKIVSFEDEAQFRQELQYYDDEYVLLIENELHNYANELIVTKFDHDKIGHDDLDLYQDQDKYKLI